MVPANTSREMAPTYARTEADSSNFAFRLQPRNSLKSNMPSSVLTLPAHTHHALVVVERQYVLTVRSYAPFAQD